MNRLNLNKISFDLDIPAKFWFRTIGCVSGFIVFIFVGSVFAEETKDSNKSPATAPLFSGMKKLTSPQGIITDFPIVPSNIIKQAGYILSLPESEGTIIDSRAKLERFGVGELVYLDTGSERGVSTGDRFAVARYDKLVYHPVLKSTSSGFLDRFKNINENLYAAVDSDDAKPLGYLVHILGELEILEVNNDVAKAIIRESYEDMMVGDRIIPTQTPPVLLDTRESVEKNIDGYIVASRIASTILAMNDIVYLDVGMDHDVALGDRFNVYVYPETTSGEEILPHTVGELLVINTQSDTSTAVVLKSIEDLKVGQKIRYKK